MKILNRNCFAILILSCLTTVDHANGQSNTPTAIPTFHSLGIYWSPVNGASTIVCSVNYRLEGSNTWKKALPLWFDDRRLDGRLEEYRGSIVNLRPGTTYEIELMLKDSTNTTAILTASTWGEEFPISKTIYLPSESDRTLEINESGSSEGYVLYTFGHGDSAVIDVKNRESRCILISENTSYIIIRGLVLRRAAKSAIRIENNCHDIVIEECDISDWGRVDSTHGFAMSRDSAIRAYGYENAQIERIIIQRNKIHHPRAGANSWAEARPRSDGQITNHPIGPLAISLYDTEGNHVIRYNKIYTDSDHYFEDIIGGGRNFSFRGFPNRDSDIYENRIMGCWDDGIEAEGANENVRIWGNYIDETYVKIAVRATSVGPLYIWRNVANTSRYSAVEQNSDEYGRGTFLKAGLTVDDDDGTRYGGGRTYVFHNTSLQEQPEPGQTYPLGCNRAIAGSALYNLITRNNIFTNYKPVIPTRPSWLENWTFRERPEHLERCGTNDFDYDLYTGFIKDDCPEIEYQSLGIHLESNDQIIFNPDDPAGAYALMPETPGHDAGEVIPNFNDNYIGKAPDMGAIEASVPIVSGVSDSKNGRIPGFELFQNYPNPFNPETTINYQIAKESRVNLAIYNILGQRIVTLVDEKQRADLYSVEWDGKDGLGKAVSSGIYLYRLETQDSVQIKKLVLVR